MGEGDQHSSSAERDHGAQEPTKKLHVVFLTMGSVALLAAIGGLIAWGVMIASNNCLVHEDLTDEGAAPPVLANLDWWQHCVVYEVYPLSFKDSDGDGIGDLKGIMDHLNHFKDAGVDAIMLNPIFESPMRDFGFDIANAYDIDPLFGDMKDFENLLNRAHDMGIKVLLNFVPNHASIESKYFRKSEAGDPDYKDFFVWADGIPDPDDPTKMMRPSNWVSVFSGSAWEWNEKRRQYYLHQFDVTKADFNYRDPAVRQEMLNIMGFWLNKGVDGFWPGNLNFLIEANPADYEDRYPDNPVYSGVYPLYTMDQIELYDVVYQWRQFIDKYNEEHGGDTRVFFSYAYSNITMTMLYYGNKTGALGAHIPFNIDLALLPPKSNARDFVYTIMKWLTYMPHGAVANWRLFNHNNKRMASRFLVEMVDGLNSLIMMLPGTSFTYQGEEIGMKNGYVSWEETLDMHARRQGNESTYLKYSRDPTRTPFHWDDSLNAGFSTGESTWLPVAQDYTEINLAKQKADERSHFKVYQALTALRKEKTLSHGDHDIKALTNSCFYVVRSLRTYDTLVFLFNVGEDPDTIVLSRVPHLKTPATVYVSSIHSSRDAGDIIDDERLNLAAGEALILRVPPV